MGVKKRASIADPLFLTSLLCVGGKDKGHDFRTILNSKGGFDVPEIKTNGATMGGATTQTWSQQSTDCSKTSIARP